MDKYAGWDRRNDRYCYDLLRQLTAHIKKTYIHKTTAGNDYNDYRSSPTHCLPVQILSPLAHTNISRRVTLCIKPNKIISRTWIKHTVHVDFAWCDCHSRFYKDTFGTEIGQHFAVALRSARDFGISSDQSVDICS